MPTKHFGTTFAPVELAAEPRPARGAWFSGYFTAVCHTVVSLYGIHGMHRQLLDLVSCNSTFDYADRTTTFTYTIYLIARATLGLAASDNIPEKNQVAVGLAGWDCWDPLMFALATNHTF